MRSILAFLVVLVSCPVLANELEMTFSERSSDEVKTFLMDKAELIIAKAHLQKIEIYKRDIERMQCMSTGQGLGSCVISGDAFAPNSSTRWLINVTAPEAFSCDYSTTKVTFQFLDSEC